MKILLAVSAAVLVALTLNPAVTGGHDRWSPPPTSTSTPASDPSPTATSTPSTEPTATPPVATPTPTASATATPTPTPAITPGPSPSTIPSATPTLPPTDETTTTSSNDVRQGQVLGAFLLAIFGLALGGLVLVHDHLKRKDD